jgi:hypothetical protein
MEPRTGLPLKLVPTHVTSPLSEPQTHVWISPRVGKSMHLLSPPLALRKQYFTITNVYEYINIKYIPTILPVNPGLGTCGPPRAVTHTRHT